MKVDEIRDSYLSFFAKRAHVVVKSDSLVPAGDPTLLFTGAGMNQFKEYFLGLKKDMRRATTSQKCLRTGDLEEVGRTPFHHSFFEMLGNFSFGDYFKDDTIRWAWGYLTEVLGIPVERLRVSVHKEDSEAYHIWRDKIKVREDWIYSLGDKSNFWPANAPADGPNGPCGPCSEIYYDQHPDSSDDDLEGSRFAEIWNLVFTQFDRQDGGKLPPLANKNIDTGMGLERLACVLQGKKSNFQIDSFEGMLTQIRCALALPGEAEVDINHLYAIADHVRAAVFAIGDGVLPSNEGRGYVIRKLIRRALWRAHQLLQSEGLRKKNELREPFLYSVVSAVAEAAKKGYPEIEEARESITSSLRGEEERFLDTLETGLAILEGRLKMIASKKAKVLKGEDVFELYDTYGFPDELTRFIAASRGFEIDQAGFQSLMKQQRQRAKDATQISSSIFVTGKLEEQLLALPKSDFLGYDALQAEGKIVFVDLEGSNGIVVLDQTPFYAESGGQAGDQGMLTGESFSARVVDTQKKDAVIMHVVEVKSGQAVKGASVLAAVDKSERFRIMRNHTATHLLHAALRQLLGTTVRQMGSLVNSRKLRFDYSYSKALDANQLFTLENLVNDKILENVTVSKREESFDQAKNEGAMAFFGEKYGEKVRVLTIGDFSKELCGGTHCDATGQIGSFVIMSDSSVASGTRRIEAVTGEGAIEFLRRLRDDQVKIAAYLKVTPGDVVERVKKLQDNVKKLEKEKKRGGGRGEDARQILTAKVKAGKYQFLPHRLAQGAEAPELRRLSDELRNMIDKTVYLLAAANEEKIHFLLGMTPDLKADAMNASDKEGAVTATELGQRLSPLLKASSGGRIDLVQGGAANEGQLESNWDEMIKTAVSYLSAKG
ncbi:MAG: alanine--tRNA ligase [Candidatus Omnitrophota bacterium]|nr:alanine--tRNA ligase [Candidatus Omnitrophota bacterium]